MNSVVTTVPRVTSSTSVLVRMAGKYGVDPEKADPTTV